MRRRSLPGSNFISKYNITMYVAQLAKAPDTQEVRPWFKPLMGH